MQLRFVHDPFLRSTVKKVTVFDAELKRQADEMFKIMKDSVGLGLAANQVGLDKRILVLGYEPENKKDDIPRIPFQAVVNPTITKFSQKKEEMYEGCVSFPGLEVPVKRSVGVTVEAQDLTGKSITIRAKGLQARILQHEIDHLNGILFTDYLKSGQRVDLGFLRIVFFGSDEFSLPVFQGLKNMGLNVMAVVTETAKPSGRGQELKEPLLAQVAKKSQLAVFQPEDKDEIVSVLRQLKPDLLVLASYGKILPAEALAVPPFGCLNVHPSLLPKYRGATPIQSAILSGDKKTGVSIMQMEGIVDAGGLVAQAEVPISDTETFQSLKEKTAEIGADLLSRVLPGFVLALIEARVQDESAATRAAKLSKKDGEINWDDDLAKIDRQIRALNPWPGAYTQLGEKRLKILEAKRTGNKLEFVMVQLEGKNPAIWTDFVRGHQGELTATSWYGKITK